MKSHAKKNPNEIDMLQPQKITVNTNPAANTINDANISVAKTPASSEKLQNSIAQQSATDHWEETIMNSLVLFMSNINRTIRRIQCLKKIQLKHIHS